MDNAKRMKTMLGYLPCKASGIPLNLRNLRTAEIEGLARMEPDYTWHLTPKGEAFLSGKLAAPKSSRRMA